MIIFLLKEKKRDSRNSIQKPQSGAVKVLFVSIVRTLMDGLRELDRMHHETGLGEQACMFFHA